MAVCARCERSLEGTAGLLRCREHGVFVLGSTLRGPAGLRLGAALAGAIARGTAAPERCPSCRNDLRTGEVEAPGGARIPLLGCPACNGVWLDHAAVDGLRSAGLSRDAAKPRILGGYAGTTVSRGDERGRAGEALFAHLRDLGAFP